MMNQYNCSCCRCLFKFGFVIIWNFFALSMIFSFFMGSILSLIGRIGNDLALAFPNIISQDNFGRENPIIIQQFETGKEILEEFFLGEGNLSKVFDLNNYIEDFNTITETKNKMQKYKEIFSDLTMNYPAYNILKSLLENKTQFINDTYLYYYDSAPRNNDIVQKIKLDDIIKSLNDSIDDISPERFDKFNGNINVECIRDYSEIGSPQNNLLHPLICEPIDRNWIISTNNEIKNFAKITSDIIDLLKYANGTKNPGVEGFQNYYDILTEFKTDIFYT